MYTSWSTSDTDFYLKTSIYFNYKTNKQIYKTKNLHSYDYSSCFFLFNNLENACYEKKNNKKNKDTQCIWKVCALPHAITGDNTIYQSKSDEALKHRTMN